MITNSTRRLSFLGLTLLMTLSSRVWAQDAATPKPAEAATPAASTATPDVPAADVAATEKKKAPLDIGQQAVLNRFDRFEREMIQMAGQLRQSDPERADLLFRAHSRSQQERIVGQMRVILGLLAEGKKFGEPAQRQEALLISLKALLEVLQSENRMSEIEKERARILGILRDVNKIIGQEQDARAVNERGASSGRAAEKQEGVEKNTSDVIDKVKQQDSDKQAEQDGKPSEGKPSEGKPSEGKPSEGKPSEGKPSEGKPSEGKPSEGKPSEGKPSEGKPSEGKPSEGKPSEGKPSEGKPSEGKPSEGGPQPEQNKTPGREELEEARTEMEKAIEELRKKQNREGASKHQDEAIRKLLEAKEKLEEILRQLREEEKELLLANLEARFRKMLGLQLLIYQQTVRLDAEKTQDSTVEIGQRSRQLATQEEEIVQEVAKALVLLQAEGSSVAFPQAVEAIREDASSVVRLLDQSKVGELTQTVEQAIIEALEEMIDALQKEMEKLEEQKQQEQQQQQQQEQDQPLVDALSELKMLRSLQLRINRITRRLSRQIDGDQAEGKDLLEQLKTLARRQAKIQEATYDLATGKNQ
jgi:hypothetical protein